MYVLTIRYTAKLISLIWRPEVPLVNVQRQAGEAMIKYLEKYTTSSISSTAHPNTTLRDMKG